MSLDIGTCSCKTQVILGYDKYTPKVLESSCEHPCLTVSRKGTAGLDCWDRKATIPANLLALTVIWFLFSTGVSYCAESRWWVRASARVRGTGPAAHVDASSMMILLLLM